MDVVRRIWTVLFGAWVAAVLASGLFDWILGLDRSVVRVAVLVAAVLGGVASIREARELDPLRPAERRDTLLGWGALVGAVAAIACLYLPLPWGALAAATVVAVTVVGLQRIPYTQR